MPLYCNCCGRDLDTIWQDNMSYDPDIILCEDCAGINTEDEYRPDEYTGIDSDILYDILKDGIE